MGSAGQTGDLAGRIAIVTGANSGIGWEAALQLARRGARTILACRDGTRGQAAVDRIRAACPTADIEVSPLDLASLASVKAFAQRFSERFPKLDLLVNNAGVMAIPRRETADGFEMQFGTNHLGHFALTGNLLDRLVASGNARVVTLSSAVHWFGRVNLEDLHGRRAYGSWAAYCQSKLANLLFMLEFNRRLRAANLPIISTACHPGYAATNLQFVGPSMTKSSFGQWFMSVGNRLVAQSAASGALPTLHAATAPNVQGGQYFGPRFLMLWGAPARARISATARNEGLARDLWTRSVEMTGVTFAALPKTP